MSNPQPTHQKEAWKRQRELQARYKDLPSIEELGRLVDGIHLDDPAQELRAKALISLYYLTAGRCSEMVKVIRLKKRMAEAVMLKRHLKPDEFGQGLIGFKQFKDKHDQVVYTWFKEINYLGICKDDIKFEEVDGHKFMVLRIDNRKNKGRTSKRLSVPIEFESCLIKHIEAYLNAIKSDKLFEFGVKRAQQVINQALGWNCHFIRHIRATHLITQYDFNTQLLVNFMGWTDSKPAKRYLELKTSDIAREFYKNRV